MFIDPRQHNAIMRQLDLIEEWADNTSVGPSHDPLYESVGRIRKLLTDQPLAPTATPE